MKSGIKMNIRFIAFMAFVLFGLNPVVYATYGHQMASPKEVKAAFPGHVKNLAGVLAHAGKQFGKEAGLVRSPETHQSKGIKTIAHAIVHPIKDAAETCTEKKAIADLIKDLHEYAREVDTAKNQFFNLGNKEKYSVHLKRSTTCLHKIKKLEEMAEKLRKKYPASKMLEDLYIISSKLHFAQNGLVHAINPKTYQMINTVSVGLELQKLEIPAKDAFREVDAKLKDLKPHVDAHLQHLLESIHTILDHVFNTKMGKIEGMQYITHRLSKQ